jgi:nucleotide-binding universal stress UspA family protein
MKITKVLIAYDGSEWADAALEDLRRAGLPEKAHAIVLSVVESWWPPPAASLRRWPRAPIARSKSCAHPDDL